MPRWIKFALPLFTVLCLVLVIVGVATHSEAGLMRACERLNGRMVPGDCEDLHMGQAPLSILSIVLDTKWGYSTDTITKAQRRAVRDFNSMVGCKVFTLDLLPGLAPVVATYNVNPDRLAAANAGQYVLAEVRHRRVSGQMQATIDVADYRNPLLYVVIMHELGHVAGLAHDDFASSLMYERADARGYRPTYHLLTDDDAKLLRLLYCN